MYRMAPQFAAILLMMILMHVHILHGTSTAAPKPTPVRIPTDLARCAALWGGHYLPIGTHMLFNGTLSVAVVDTEQPRLHCGVQGMVGWKTLPHTWQPSATDNCDIVFCRVIGQ